MPVLANLKEGPEPANWYSQTFEWLTWLASSSPDQLTLDRCAVAAVKAAETILAAAGPCPAPACPICEICPISEALTSVDLPPWGVKDSAEFHRLAIAFLAGALFWALLDLIALARKAAARGLELLENRIQGPTVRPVTRSSTADARRPRAQAQASHSLADYSHWSS